MSSYSIKSHTYEFLYMTNEKYDGGKGQKSGEKNATTGFSRRQEGGDNPVVIW